MRRFLGVFLFALLFLTVLSNFLVYEHRLRNNFSETRERLMLIASNAALSIDAEDIFNIPLEQRSEGTPGYMVIYHKLVEIKKANPSIKYVYIMTTTGQPGILQYVVDADPVPQIITAHCPTSLPGDKYDARMFPEMMAAYNGPSADKKITTDVWGIFISGYAPIRDSEGRSVAILGVDSDASSMRDMQKGAKVRGKIALFAGILFLVSFITLIKRG
ncbi:MAG: hypothetical protein NTW18_06760 [Candidatus Omnitrophica bacterium]|nr:hypothetical protein [Candidatus Omnitrophota bacterium]